MSDPNGTKPSFPQANIVIRDDGDVVVEMIRSNEVVGELNFSNGIRTLLQAFGFTAPKAAPVESES